MTPLQLLMEGNARYVSGKPLRRNQDTERRVSLTQAQNPFAIVVSCSDSRVPSEIIFDQGIGDLFVVRVAGNVIGPVELESIEFAADYLGSSLILLFGHQNCGAVNSVVQNNKGVEDFPTIASFILPSADEARKMSGDILTNAIKLNAIRMVEQLKARPTIERLIKDRDLKIVCGYYSFDTGKVELLAENPQTD